MPVAVVELLEVVDVDHRHREVADQLAEHLVEAAARRQRGQRVLVGQPVGDVDHRLHEHQAGGGEVGRGYESALAGVERQESGD